MEYGDCIERILSSYERYYDISRLTADLFYAKAVFSVKTEEYFLVKSARLSVTDSYEYAFFALKPSLTADDLAMLCAEAWEETLRQTHPFFGHRNTDCALVVVTDTVTDEIKRMTKRARFYKSYKAGLFGWSSFSLCVVGAADGRVAHNGRGEKDAKRIRRQLQALATAAAADTVREAAN